MIPKHQREAISRHEERLNELLHAAVEELESISGYGLGESDWNEADGTITFLFQDVSLLKRFRQRCVQPSRICSIRGSCLSIHTRKVIVYSSTAGMESSNR